MTKKELAKIVADEFKNDMVEHEFDTFTEMKECFWWTSSDIKEEVVYIVNHAGPDCSAYDEGDIYLCGENHIENDYCTYRKFINLVYGILKAEGIYA